MENSVKGMSTTKNGLKKTLKRGLATKVQSRKIDRKKIKVLSLFSGCGGLDLGMIGNFKFRNHHFPKTKFEVVMANDIDPAATKVYRANSHFFKNHEIVQEDVKNISHKSLPAFDFLIAGFPCQPFSNAGLRKGISDDRGTLFEECERILRKAEKTENPPIGFLFENVRGIMSSKMPDGTTIPDEIVKRTKKLGYHTVYKLVKASDYGVPSSRYRLIIVGLKKQFGEFDFSLMDSIVSEYGLPNENKAPYDLLLGSILSDIPSHATEVNDHWPYSPSGQYMIEKIGPCFGNDKVLNMFREKRPLEELPKKVFEGRSWKNMDRQDMSPRFQKIFDNPTKYRAPNFYRRFALTEINGTITASAQPENCGITHPLYNRRFTIREIARIQSFPDEFVFPYTTIVNAYKVIGNAVPPILGWVVAKAIEKHLDK